MLNPHPGLPEFDYIKLASLEEASQFLAAHVGESRPFLGGTDTFVRLRDGVWKDKYLVDVKGLDGTNELAFDGGKGLTIGSAVSMNRVIASPDAQQHYPALVEAASTVASYQLRSRATIVGNICNASPAGDAIGACILYDGELHVHGTAGTRMEPLSSFFTGPGQTVLKAGDVVTALTLPLPPEGHVAKYIKLGRNKIGDLALVGVTALAYPDGDVPSGYHFRLALASVAPTPLVPTAAEDVLNSKKITEETIAEAAAEAMAVSKPIDDVRGSARYRQYMVRNLVRQAVTDVWQRLK